MTTIHIKEPEQGDAAYCGTSENTWTLHQVYAQEADIPPGTVCLHCAVIAHHYASIALTLAELRR